MVNDNKDRLVRFEEMIGKSKERLDDFKTQIMLLTEAADDAVEAEKKIKVAEPIPEEVEVIPEEPEIITEKEESPKIEEIKKTIESLESIEAEGEQLLSLR